MEDASPGDTHESHIQWASSKFCTWDDRGHLYHSPKGGERRGLGEGCEEMERDTGPSTGEPEPETEEQPNGPPTPFTLERMGTRRQITNDTREREVESLVRLSVPRTSKSITEGREWGSPDSQETRIRVTRRGRKVRQVRQRLSGENSHCRQKNVP